MISASAFAQTPLVTEAPICTKIINETDGSVRGTFLSDTAPLQGNAQVADGTLARHSTNFKLEIGEEMDVCSRGPFFPGYRLELKIKTLIPIFDCQTALTGPIRITSERDEDGTRQVKATCY